jgi:hypothetical protein
MNCIKDEHYVEYKDCFICMREYKATSECYVMVRKEWVKDRFAEWNIEYDEDWYKDRELRERINKIPYTLIEGRDLPMLAGRVTDTICHKCKEVHKELVESEYIKGHDSWRINGYIVMAHDWCKSHKLNQLELNRLRKAIKLESAKDDIKKEVTVLRLNKIGLDSISNDKYWE